MAELHRRTEGWPAGLYLAALYLREGGPLPGAAVSFGGDDRLVSEYVESEFLARISRRQRAFLTRTAVLERMCGPLCEAVLDAARVRRGPGGSGPVEPAAGAAGPAGTVVPLPPPVPRHAAGGAGTPGARPDPGPAAPRRRLVPAQRPARGSAGVLHGRRGRRCGRPPGGTALACRPTGRAGSPPSSGGSGGWRTGAGSRDTRWPRCWPRCLAALTGRPAEAERWADAVDRWQYGDAARPDDPSAEAWAAAAAGHAVPARGRADARRRRRGRAQVRGGGLRDADDPRSCRGSRASFPVTSMAATRPWRMRSASGRKSARPRISRSRCANGRWWRWHAANGTGPRPSPARHAPLCAGPGSRTATRRPWSARCKPAWPCTGETSRRRARNSSAPSGCGLC